jgi:hypothetical protein
MLLKILFIFYYGKLRLRVLFGAHQTSRPLGIKWRWNHWIYNFQERSNRLF